LTSFVECVIREGRARTSRGRRWGKLPVGAEDLSAGGVQAANQVAAEVPLVTVRTLASARQTWRPPGDMPCGRASRAALTAGLTWKPLVIVGVISTCLPRLRTLT